MNRDMLISICIPHYNRSKYLIAVLESIRTQDYPYLEVIISDDCSTDDSQKAIPAYIASVKGKGGPVFRYIRQEKNLGYDGNLRAALGAANGEYLFILGNDDALSSEDSMSRLAKALKDTGYPEVAVTSVCYYSDKEKTARDAGETGIIGSGADTALKNFRLFSFVGGLAMKRAAFAENDTDRYDGSIYVQIYICSRIISSGGTLATIAEAIVAKDVSFEGEEANSYLDVLAKQNKNFARKTGGLDRVGKVACDAILPFVPDERHCDCIKSIYGQILAGSYAFWLYDYRKNGVWRASFNLALGCFPSRLVARRLPFITKVRLMSLYALITLPGLIVPVALLEKLTGVAKMFARAL